MSIVRLARVGALSIPAVASAALGCGWVAGIDDFKPPIEGGTGAAGAGGGAAGAGSGVGGVGGEGGIVLPTCEGGVCVPPVPAGWLGPVCADLSADAAGACDRLYPTVALFGGIGNPGGDICTDCSCEPPNGAACAFEVAFYSDSTCQTPAGSTVAFPTCAPIESSVSVRPLDTVLPGACSAVGGESLDEPAFGVFGRLCEADDVFPPSDSCEDGAACVPDPGCTFCVYREGAQDCPAGFSQRHGPLQDFTDTRTCGSCECGEPSGGECDTWQLGLYLGGCTPLEQVGSVSSGQCVSVVGAYDRAIAVGNRAVSDPGTCSVTQGGPSGAVEVGEIHTVCCAN